MDIRYLAVSAIFLSTQVNAVTLDEVFINIKTCSFSGFYYAPWSKEPTHPYLAGRQPSQGSSGDLYYFKTSDTLFGLPVSEIRVPGTWGFHSVTFDKPLTEVRKVVRKKFGSNFPISTKSRSGEVPALVASTTNKNQSILYCNEPDEGN